MDSPLLAADAEARRPVAVAARSPGGLTAVAVLAPAVAACTALLLHWFLPVRQMLANGEELPTTWMDDVPAWQRPYPVLLASLLAVALLSALAQWAWRPLRPWVHHYGPLVAGGLFLLCLWELVTAKFGWLLRAHFPAPEPLVRCTVED